MKNKFLIALPSFKGDKGLNHRTILVSAKDVNDAISFARHIHPHCNIGDIREYTQDDKLIKKYNA